MKKTIRHRLAGVLLLTLGGCVGPVEIAPLPYAHPANPDAPAGRTAEVGSMLDAPPSGAGERGGGATMPGMDHSKMAPAAGGGPAGGVEMSPGNMKHGNANTGPAKAAGKFQCPMHAQVRSDKSGRCPVCGMKLVGTKDRPEHEGDHER